MIVTRERPRRSALRRLIVPALVLAALAFVLIWPPSQRLLAQGPLKPVWGPLASAGAIAARPFSIVAAQQQIGDRDRTIRGLNADLDKQRQARSDADDRARQLQEQVAELSSQQQPVPAPRVRPPAAVPFGAEPESRSNRPSSQDKRLAATWSAMDPDKAAAVVQRLPLDEATRVLGAMDADSAGAIMDALPAVAAARISRAVAQVATTTDR